MNGDRLRNSIDQVQVKAQAAALASAYDRAVQDYFTVANQLHGTLALEDHAPLLPVGFAALLAQEEERIDDPSAGRNNPAYRQAAVRILTVAAIHETRGTGRPTPTSGSAPQRSSIKATPCSATRL